MQDEYQTISKIAESYLTVKKSRFIGLATGVRSQDEFTDFMKYARKSFPAASHYCYAYTIGSSDAREERSNDAGEPRHSAGPPILSAVQASKLTNIGCIVIRYFGGIKLGIGGLIRAYGRCARDCLANATIHTEVFMERLIVTTPYETLGSIIQRVERARGHIEDIQYDQSVEIRLKLRLRAIPNFIGEMNGLHSAIEIRKPSEKIIHKP